jgi:hypothetical protein
MSSSGEGGWPWGNDSANALNSLGGMSSAGGTISGPMSYSIMNTFALDSYVGTDDQKMASALAAASAAGGGAIQLSARVHTFANQWFTAYSSSADYCIRISGSGGIPHGNSESAPVGVTTCAMSYASTGAARMNFQHAGSIEIDHILFTDSGGSSVPFFQTTNANAYIHDCAFKGSATNQSCFQDAINMGGLGTTLGTGGDNGPFQGYQSVVERCSFFGIRSCVAMRTYANSVSVRDCLVDASSGSANPVSVTDGAMTLAGNTLTCATSTPFTSAMVGLPVIVAGAGTAELGQYYVGVITAFTDSAHVTLSGSGAAQAVSGATVIVTNAAAFSIGTSALNGGVEGCVIDDCCIEVSNYAIGILINQSNGNAVIGTALWDGTVGESLIGVACVNASFHNYIHITESGIATASIYSSDYNGTTAGQDVVFALNNSTSFVQLPSVTMNGSQALKLFGTSSSTPGLASGLAFGPAGGPADTQIYRDTAGNINLAPKSGSGVYALGGTTANNLYQGPTTNYALLGPQSTSSVYLSAAGSNTNISLNFTTKGTGNVNAGSKLSSTVAATPTIVANTAAGSGASASVVGNDQRGTITITTGSGPTTGDLATLTFTTTGGTFASAPVVVVCGGGSSGQAASLLDPYVVSEAATNFHLGAGIAASGATTYTFNYIVLG